MGNNSKNTLRFGFHRPRANEDHTSFRLSGLNLYLFLCFIVFLLVGSAFLLVRYTPFSEWVRDDRSINTREVTEIKSRLAIMQKRLDAQSMYIQTLKGRANGELVDTIPGNVENVDTQDRAYAQRIPLDDTLRRRVLKSNMNIPVRTPFIMSESEERNMEDEFLIPPIRGSVRKSFALEEGHYGVDIIAPENSAVKSTKDGLVIESDWTLEGGNTMVIQHENNLISVYKHNSALLKKKGEQVKTGEAIAIIGNTGLHSAGPHVHFELWHRGEPLNPEAYIELDLEKPR